MSSVLQRFHHGPVSSLVLVPAMIAIGIGGLVLAAWAHRRSSVVLGILVCATTGLIISPITWVHHLVWVVPAIIWMAAGADRPRGGRLLAGFATVLFIAAPIWWTPVSWSAAHYPPELRWDHWQLLFGNSFFFALVAFLVGVAVMLKRRGNVSLRRPPALATIGHLDPWHGPVRPLNNRGHGENQRNDDIVDPDTEGLELVGSRRSEAVNSRA